MPETTPLTVRDKLNPTHEDACRYADTSTDPLISMARDAYGRLLGETPDIHGASVSLHGVMLGIAHQSLARRDGGDGGVEAARELFYDWLDERDIATADGDEGLIDRIVAALRQPDTAADPRPDPRDEALRVVREAMSVARDAVHQHYVDWDGEPEDADGLLLSRSKIDQALAKINAVTGEPG